MQRTANLVVLVVLSGPVLLTTAGCARPVVEPSDAKRTAPDARLDAALDAALDVGLGDGGFEAALNADASSAAEGTKTGHTAFADLFSAQATPYDVQRAYERTFAATPIGAAVALSGAVVLCRVGLTEPAPRAKSAWDRANGRDLMIETIVDGRSTQRFEGPLGKTELYMRADADLRDAAAGRKVRWLMHDRDQTKAYPYETSFVVGSLDVPQTPAFHTALATPTMNVTCRALRELDAIAALLPAADRALAEAESKMSWKPTDPRPAVELRDLLEPSAESIRIGSVLARSLKKTESWDLRRERLKAIVNEHSAREAEWLARLVPVPVGTWASVGPTMAARAFEYVCPAIPPGAEPGSLNDDQRTGCGLVIELKSVGSAKVAWNADPYGPAYACRDFGPVRLTPLEGDGGCVLGFQQGAAWQKSWVVLSSTTTTRVVVGGRLGGRALRITLGAASAFLALPPPP